jgi:WD40 repeat protein
MLVSPTRERKLDSRVSGVMSTADGNRVVVGTEPGQILVFEADLEQTSNFSVGKGMKCLTLSPDGKMLVLSNRKTLVVAGIDGRPVHEETTQLWRGDGFDSALFSADGSTLWVIRHLEGQQVALELRETRGWRVLRRTTIAEPAPPTFFSLHPHPEGQIVVVWAAAGQDGQWVFWAYDDGSQVRVHEVKPLACTTPPAFHPAGGEFLVVQAETDDEIRRYSFPDCTEIDRLEWGEEDNCLGGGVCYLSDEHALFNSNHGRLFLTDLGRMIVTDEVVLEGHGPRPVNELYPTLKDDLGLCTDFYWIHTLGLRGILSVHDQLPELEGVRHSTLVLWDTTSLFGRFKQVDELLPYTAALLQSLGWD